MKISFVKSGFPATGIVVVTAFSNGKMTPSASKLNKKVGGALTRAIRGSHLRVKKDNH